MTLGGDPRIAVLKLIGTRNRTIAGMILQQALGLGLIGFVVVAGGRDALGAAFPNLLLLSRATRCAACWR